MIFITYFKEDGSIATPCGTCNVEQDISVFGDKSEIMAQIYDITNITLKDESQEQQFLNELIKGSYKININTKQPIKVKNDIEFI
jgi:cytidine deaminase